MKNSAVLIVFASVFFLSTSTANASILTVKSTGDVIQNVLSSEDQIALGVPSKNDLTVKKVSEENNTDKSIFLKKENEKIYLKVGEENNMDVTNIKDGIIEIEERGDTKRVNISVVDGKFVITEANVTAKTDLPINVDPKENELSVVTSTGAIFLSVLPLEATETALRSKVMSKIIDKNLDLTEKDLGTLAYTVRGEREINIFNIVNMKVPVTTFVSTTTGEIVSTDQPKWLSMLGFLFT